MLKRELIQRVKELEQAIKDSNSWIKSGEGVDLLYYYEEYFDEEESFDVIKRLLFNEVH